MPGCVAYSVHLVILIFQMYLMIWLVKETYTVLNKA